MWILGPLVVGGLTFWSMYGICNAMAMAMMAGPVDSSSVKIVCIVAVPAAFVSGFLTRRLGFVRALTGCLIFLMWVFLFCYIGISGLSHDHPNRATLSAVFYGIAYVTAIFAVFASGAFAIIGSLKYEKRSTHDKPAA